MGFTIHGEGNNIAFRAAAVEHFLESLGESADEVAAKLRSFGVHGLPGFSQSCPISEAIRQQVPEAAGCQLFVDAASVDLVIGDSMAYIDMPEAPAAFVELFDEEELYTDLQYAMEL